MIHRSDTFTVVSSRRKLGVSIVLLAMLLVACGGAEKPVVPGAESVRIFAEGQCLLITTGGHPAFVEPGPNQIPVGTSLPGEQSVLIAATFPDGSLWYQKDDGVWFSATGADYDTRGDCNP